MLFLTTLLLLSLFSTTTTSAASYDLYVHYGNTSQQVIDKINVDYSAGSFTRTNIVRWNSALPLIYGAMDLNPSREEFHDIRNGNVGSYPVRTASGTYQMSEANINDYSCVAIDSQNGFAYGNTCHLFFFSVFVDLPLKKKNLKKEKQYEIYD